MKPNKPLNSDANTLDLIIRLCIDKIRSILTEFPDEHCKQLLNEVERRYNDPELKLAIIGEFNTGKSTFINALLKRDFLSTDNIPTTVIPTYIRWDGESKKPSIRINLMNDNKKYTISENQAFLEKKLGISLNKDDDLERITTNNDLIGVVSHVTVSFPKDERFKNFCLIDTPGANPGAEETKEHANITREILRKEADTTIILFPALVVGNRSALEFISENASHLLDGASFVITKTDMLNNEKELKKISDYLKGLVRQKYELEDQTIYTCSAMRALQAYSNNETTDNYLVQFEEMLTDMFENLAQKRKQIIFNKLSSLIKIILDDLRKEQSELTEKLKEDMKILEQYSLDNLSAEYQKLYSEFERNLDDTYAIKKNNINSVITSNRQSTYNYIESSIDLINSLGELREYAGEGIKKDIEIFYEPALKGTISSNLSEMKSVYTKFSDNLFECLKKYQLKISSKITKEGYSSNSDITPNVSMDVSMDSLLGGLGIGAAVLLFLNPVALVALLVGGFFLGDTILEIMKGRLKNKISDGLRQADSSIEQKWKSALGTAKSKYVSNGKNLMDDYKKKYKKIFDERIASDAQEKDRIEKELAKLQNILKDINVIEDAINKCSEISICNENEMFLIVKSLQDEHTEDEQVCESKNNQPQSDEQPMAKVLVVFNRMAMMMAVNDPSVHKNIYLDIDGKRTSLFYGVISGFNEKVEKSFFVTANSAHSFRVGYYTTSDQDVSLFNGAFKISESEQFVIDCINSSTRTLSCDIEHKTE